jgi:hypothetical protein
MLSHLENYKKGKIMSKTGGYYTDFADDEYQCETKTVKLNQNNIIESFTLTLENDGFSVLLKQKRYSHTQLIGDEAENKLLANSLSIVSFYNTLEDNLEGLVEFGERPKKDETNDTYIINGESSTGDFKKLAGKVVESLIESEVINPLEKPIAQKELGIDSGTRQK